MSGRTPQPGLPQPPAGAPTARLAPALRDEPTSATLGQACRFLRKLENRLRIVQDRSSSELRTDPGEIDKLARRMGYNEPQSGGGRRLLDDYLIHTGRVRELYRTFFPVSDG